LLMRNIGSEAFSNFNTFKDQMDQTLKAQKIKLSTSEKNALLSAVSWYDESADKVIKNKSTLSGDKLAKLLDKLGCNQGDLADFGYYATDTTDEYIIYETATDLRDSENVPIKERIHGYFQREVKPHVEEAWIDMNSVKIGYEISFNKYFYRHKPLRSIEEVGAEILELEKQSEGLIAQILGVSVETMA